MDVSIIITSFNYEKFIEESINSCLDQQTACKFEVIIVDDGSTDSTRNILYKYENICNIFYTQNSGVEAASNLGIKNSKAKYFIRLDADDVLKSQLVEILFNHIEKNNLAFSYSNYETIDERGKVINSVLLPNYNEDEIFERGDFLASGTIFNKNIFHKVGGYSVEHKNCGLENYELILNMISQGYCGSLVEHSLFKYRIHSSNMSIKRRKSIVNYGINLFQQKGYGKFMTNDHHPYGLKI